jgi:predicted ATPase
MRAVITGGPSVGKTTIIADLAQRGYTVVEEFATQIIKEGKILPWVDRMGFQQEVLRRQLAAEAALKDYDGPVFLDRGSFDGEAYYINDRLPVPSIFAQLDPSSYHLAFLIDELPFFEKNEVRREDIEFTRQITRVLELCYRRRHVHVIRVPAMEPKARTDFVIQQFEKHCKTTVRVEAAAQAAASVTPLFRAYAV